MVEVISEACGWGAYVDEELKRIVEAGAKEEEEELE